MVTQREGTQHTNGNVPPPGAPQPDAAAIKQQAGEAVQNVKEQAQEATGQVTDQIKQVAATQVGTQKDRATQSLNTLVDAMHQASGQLRESEGGSMFAGYIEQATGRVEQLAGHLDGREVHELIADVEDFARRQPALFLGGAFILGVFGARYLKSSSQGISSGENVPRSNGGGEAASRAMGNGNSPYGSANRTTPPAPAMMQADARESLRQGNAPHQAATPVKSSTSEMSGQMNRPTPPAQPLPGGQSGQMSGQTAGQGSTGKYPPPRQPGERSGGQ